MCHKPFHNMLLISFLVPGVGSNGVRNNHQSPIVHTRVLVPEECSDILPSLVVSEFGKTHSYKPVEDNIVRGQSALNSRPVVLHVFPQQMPDFGVGGQRDSTVMDILDSHLIGEHKIQIILYNTSVFSAAKRREADLFAINGICLEVFFLDCVVFVTASF